MSLSVSDGSSSGGNRLDQLAQAASGLMPARQLDKAEMREVMRLAIEALNERQRMAVLLSKFENMSYADIAQTMDMSQEAIKSLLSRALESERSLGTVSRTRGPPCRGLRR